MRFSVVISNYNTREYVGDAIASVLANRDPDTEIVVVDDGSTDGSQEVILGFEEEGVRAVLKENGGQASAFNQGVAHATGDVVCLLDGDDWFYPHKIRTLRGVIADNGLEGTPFLIRHPLTPVGPTPRESDPRFGGGYSLRGFVPPNHGELRRLTTPAEVRRHIADYGLYPYAGGNASVYSREMAQQVFPVPEEVSKFYGDFFPVMGSSLCGDVFLYGSRLGAYRFHQSNHSSRRKHYVSANFHRATERYLNAILESQGHGERVDIFHSRDGVRYLTDAGRPWEALSAAWRRAARLKNGKAVCDLGFTIALVAALRLKILKKQTRESGD